MTVGLEELERKEEKEGASVRYLSGSIRVHIQPWRGWISAENPTVLAGSAELVFKRVGGTAGGCVAGLDRLLG